MLGKKRGAGRGKKTIVHKPTSEKLSSLKENHPSNNDKLSKKDNNKKISKRKQKKKKKRRNL